MPCCKSRSRSDFRHRTVIPNHLVPEVASKNQPHPNRRYLGNTIKTTKYTILTFLPKNLFEQFHRFANLYFVFVVLLNWIPQVRKIDFFIMKLLLEDFDIDFFLGRGLRQRTVADTGAFRFGCDRSERYFRRQTPLPRRSKGQSRNVPSFQRVSKIYIKIFDFLANLIFDF